MAAPEQIGSLKKAADQSDAQSTLQDMQSTGAEKPFAATYEDTANPDHSVILWGGTGTLFSARTAETIFGSFFKGVSGELDGDQLSTPANIATGNVGGTLRCASITGSEIAMTTCGWVGDGAMVGMLLIGKAQADASQLAPQILTAIVIKS